MLRTRLLTPCGPADRLVRKRAFRPGRAAPPEPDATPCARTLHRMGEGSMREGERAGISFLGGKTFKSARDTSRGRSRFRSTDHNCVMACKNLFSAAGRDLGAELVNFFAIAVTSPTLNSSSDSSAEKAELKPSSSPRASSSRREYLNTTSSLKGAVFSASMFWRAFSVSINLRTTWLDPTLNDVVMRLLAHSLLR